MDSVVCVSVVTNDAQIFSIPYLSLCLSYFYLGVLKHGVFASIRGLIIAEIKMVSQISCLQSKLIYQTAK
jgi:hypothetical protein